jgi:hypothetical protein
MDTARRLFKGWAVGKKDVPKDKRCTSGTDVEHGFSTNNDQLLLLFVVRVEASLGQSR